MQVIAAHSGFYQIELYSLTQQQILRGSPSCYGCLQRHQRPRLPPFFISVVLRGRHFFFMAAEWSLHCQALHLSSREQKGGDGPEAKAPSSMAPPYYLYRVTLSDVYSQHLTVLGPLLTQESLGKTFYVGCTRGCHEQKQGFYVKWRRTDGQETENKPCLAQRPPRTRSTGFAY